MQADLEGYIRRAARRRGLRLTEVARRAGLSRQALYDAWQPGRYPSINTIISLAEALELHPLSLLQRLFTDTPQPSVYRVDACGQVDRGTFLDDGGCPDGSQVPLEARFRKAWILQNTGEQPWHGRRLVCQDGHLRLCTADGRLLRLNPTLTPEADAVAIPTTRPGEAATVEMDFTAPALPATVLSYWKMAYPDGTLCFPESRGVWAKVTAVEPRRTRQDPPEPP